MMPLSGTFRYVTVVPESGWGSPWTVQLPEPIELTGNRLRDDRLVGHSPTLEISEAEITPDVRVSALKGAALPKVLRSRLLLRATDKTHASAAWVAFHIDRGLATALLPGDLLFMGRTGGGGLGLSIVRNDRLVAAVGAASVVPLGEEVHIRIPMDVIREAEGVFVKHDAEFGFYEWPVEIRCGEHTRLLYRARTRLGAYDVFVEHGFYPGVPGKSECVAISLSGTCPDVAANASAQLLDYRHALEIAPW
jgi:hypothetical protein